MDNGENENSNNDSRDETSLYIVLTTHSSNHNDLPLIIADTTPYYN